MTRRLQAALRDASMPRLRFHDLRHGAATLLLAQGVPLTAIQETLGHPDIRVTMNVYTHAFEEQKREIADRMDAWRVQGS